MINEIFQPKFGQILAIINEVKSFSSSSSLSFSFSNVDWIDHLENPTLRNNYHQKKLSEGVSSDIILNALSILDLLVGIEKKKQYTDSSSKSVSCLALTSPSLYSESSKILIEIDQQIFPTTLMILTADQDSMLTKLFSPPWFSYRSDKVYHIETLSNSPIIFSYILLYLESLLTKKLDFSFLNSLTPENIDLLHDDCNYLSLRRLSIALSVRLYTSEVAIARKQRISSEKLAGASEQVDLLRREKAALERRLQEISLRLAATEKQKDLLKIQRLECATRWTPHVDDELIVNTSGSVWERCLVSEINGTLTALPVSGAPGHILQVESRTTYHQASCDFFQEGDVLHVDKFLPSILSVSLEQHLDNLFLEKFWNLQDYPTVVGKSGLLVNLVHPELSSHLLPPTSIQNGCTLVPSEFRVDEHGFVTIASYIPLIDENRYSELYFDLAQTFQTMLPMFEQLLDLKLTSRTLQVVVSATYYLLPSDCSFTGRWQTEELKHDHILARGWYCLANSDNISNSCLSFQGCVNSEHDHVLVAEQQEIQSLFPLALPSVRDSYKVPTVSGRAIVWENDLEYCLESTITNFGDLGIQKVISFYLIDPEVQVFSTKNMPTPHEMTTLTMSENLSKNTKKRRLTDHGNS